MITFFRKIRLDLINKGKTIQYFKYMIGEIVLVVIGILIALQINNWNELRKDNITALKLLKNLKEEIEQDSINLSIQYKFETEICLNASQILFNEHSKEHITTEYDEKIGSSFRLATFMPVINFNDNTYNELTASKLLDNFKSKTLKKTLLQYYSRLDFLNKYSDQSSRSIDNLIMNLDKYYTVIPSTQSKIDMSIFFGAAEESFTTRYDLKSFRDDKSLNPKLYELIDIHKDRLGAIENILHINQSILGVINDELNANN